MTPLPSHLCFQTQITFPPHLIGEEQESCDPSHAHQNAIDLLQRSHNTGGAQWPQVGQAAAVWVYSAITSRQFCVCLCVSNILPFGKSCSFEHIVCPSTQMGNICVWVWRAIDLCKWRILWQTCNLAPASDSAKLCQKELWVKFRTNPASYILDAMQQWQPRPPPQTRHRSASQLIKWEVSLRRERSGKLQVQMESAPDCSGTVQTSSVRWSCKWLLNCRRLPV